MRILVVEDEAALGEVFREFLLELGHQPSVVRTAEAALGKLRTERPDAIILDIHLPGMSGLDFLQLRPVRELGVPIVAVSGVVTESQARECLRLGAVDFVGKPVPFERLSEVLFYLEPLALSRPLDATARAERRRMPRLRLSVPVTVRDYAGSEHAGTSVELSVAGLKVHLPAPLGTADLVNVSFTPPDGGASITALALVRRTDPDGVALSFAHLPESEHRRLADLVRRLGH